VDTLDLLARIPYFRALPGPQRVALARRLRSVGFAPRQRIFEEGAPCTGLWIVADGHVKVHRISPRGREQVLHVEGRAPRWARCRCSTARLRSVRDARTAARLLWLPRRARRCAALSWVALAIIAILARRERSRAAGDLTLRSVRARPASDEAVRVGALRPGGEITLPGTRDEIGADGTVRCPSRARGAGARGPVTVRGGDWSCDVKGWKKRRRRRLAGDGQATPGRLL
jgi:CRP/FNR family transcriptional regulator